MPYLTPVLPVGSTAINPRNRRARAPLRYMGNQRAISGGQILQAKYRAIQMRRVLTGLGLMGVMPTRAIRFNAKSKDRAALISGMGCSHCRTGMSWLGQDDSIDVTPAAIPTDLDISGDMSSVVPLTETSPVSVDLSQVPLQPIALPTTITASTTTVPPLTGANPVAINLAPPTGPTAAYQTPAKNPPSQSWLQKQTVQGVSNGWLLAAGALIIGLGAVMGKG